MSQQTNSTEASSVSNLSKALANLKVEIPTGDKENKQQKTEENILYYSIRLDEESMKKVQNSKEVLDTNLDAKKKPNFERVLKRVEFHTTCWHPGSAKMTDEEKKNEHQKFSELLGKEYTLTVEKVVWDTKATALILKKDFPCANVHAHITVLLSDGTAAFYSNQLAENAEKGEASSATLSMKLTGTMVKVVATHENKGNKQQAPKKVDKKTGKQSTNSSNNKK